MGLFGGVSNEDLALLVLDAHNDLVDTKKMLVNGIRQLERYLGEEQDQNQEAERPTDMQLLRQLIEQRFACLEEQQEADRTVADFRVSQCFEQLTKAFEMIQELQERLAKEDQEYENYESERKGLRSEFV